MKLRCLMVAVPAMLWAPAAFAGAVQQGPAQEGYGGGGGVQNEVGQAAANVAAGGTLPFTGLDLALLVIGGLTLLMVGMALRRVVKRGA